MQEKTPRRSNAARTEVMRATLLNAARELFAEKGFAETSTPEIVRKAEVTRGALYHHFEDKAALFRAVVEREAAMVAEAIDRNAPKGKDPLAMLIDGAAAYFEAMTASGRIRLLLLDGPAVIGPLEIKKIFATHDGEQLRLGLAALLEGKDMPVAALATILAAGFDRAALALADGEDEAVYRDAIGILLSALDAFRR